MWTCPKCGAKVDASFEVCWNCGTSRDGVEDPNFVRADEAPPIDDPTAEIVPEISEEEGEAIEHAPPVELVVAYWASNHVEAKFLADKLTEQEIPAVADTHGRIPELVSGLPNARVWVRVEDLLRARAWLEEHERRHKAEHHHWASQVAMPGDGIGPTTQRGQV